MFWCKLRGLLIGLFNGFVHALPICFSVTICCAVWRTTKLGKLPLFRLEKTYCNVSCFTAIGLNRSCAIIHSFAFVDQNWFIASSNAHIWSAFLFCFDYACAYLDMHSAHCTASINKIIAELLIGQKIMFTHSNQIHTQARMRYDDDGGGGGAMNKCVNTLLLIDIFSFETHKMAMVSAIEQICGAAAWRSQAKPSRVELSRTELSWS